MTYKVFSSFWEMLFNYLFPGGYLTLKHGWWLTLFVFSISTLSLLLQIKIFERKKILYTILLNFLILLLTMFVPALLGVYGGFVISNGYYSIKAQRNLNKISKILLGIINTVGLLGVIGICGIYIYFWRYIYHSMIAVGLVLGILAYLISPIRAFYFSLPENITISRIKKIGLATGICFVVLTVGFCCLGFIRPYEPAPQSYTPTGSMEVTVVSYNIRQGTAREPNEFDNWKHRKDDIATQIDTFDADFICIQEAFNFQIRYLTKTLQNRTYRFFGAGRDDGVSSGEHSGILFDSERFEVITGGNFWLSDYSYWPSHSWESESSSNRVISWARFEEIATEDQVVVAGVHYSWGDTWREKANVMLNERIAEYSGGVPTIVAGDFNLNTSKSHWNLLENYGTKPLQSAYHLVHGPGHHYNITSNGFDPITRDHGSYMIDFIFVSSDVLVMSCDILYDTYIGPDGLEHCYSDHYPVIAHCII